MFQIGTFREQHSVEHRQTDQQPRRPPQGQRRRAQADQVRTFC